MTSNTVNFVAKLQKHFVNIFENAEEAVKDIKDGSTLLVGGII